MYYTLLCCARLCDVWITKSVGSMYCTILLCDMGVSAKSVGSKLCTILVLCVGGCVSIRLCCESV